MKYAPLEDYLKGIAPSKADITLSFVAIEKIIKAKLPASAGTHRAWWGNEKSGSHTQARHWQSAGFIVDSVDLKRKLIYFRRDTAASTAPEPSEKHSLLQDLKRKLAYFWRGKT